MQIEPMLAGKCTDVAKLSFPVLVSVKLDGVRALAGKHEGDFGALSLRQRV
jgi:hypothetical protein